MISRQYTKSDLTSLTIPFLKKLFNTNSVDMIINYCQYFASELPSILWAKHVGRSEKFAECNFCNISASVQ